MDENVSKDERFLVVSARAIAPRHASSMSPTPSTIVPAPSPLHLVTSWSSTPRPPALTVRVATTLSSLATRTRATPIFGTPASSVSWLAPTPRLHPRAAPSAASCLSPSPPSDKISTVGLACPRAHCLVVHNAPPAYGTRTHRPSRHRPRPARAPGLPRAAVPFTGRTAPPLAIGVSSLHLYVCGCASVECVCAMFCVCVMCVLALEPPVLHQQASAPGRQLGRHHRVATREAGLFQYGLVERHVLNRQCRVLPLSRCCSAPWPSLAGI
jgi:hypothetical protein